MFRSVNGTLVALTETEIQEVLTRRELAAQEEEARILEEQRTEYMRLRQAEYPPLGEQLDMMYHDQVNGTNHWFELIESIKLKYPKPDQGDGGLSE